MCDELAQAEVMKRTIKAAAKCECVPLLRGEHLAFSRTRDPNGDIFMQTMSIRPGRTLDFAVQCWTCANFRNQIFRREMFAGRRVRVHGLQTAAEHNDKQGVVLKLLDGGRVGVRLNANQPFGAKEISVKRENLDLLPLEETVVPSATLAAGSSAGRGGDVSKTFLVCWPLSMLAKLKPQTQFNSHKGPAEQAVADLTFSDQLKYRLRISINQEGGSRPEKSASITAQSLQKGQPLTNFRGPVLTSTCALLSRPQSAPYGPLTVLFPPIPASSPLPPGSPISKIAQWTECRIGDARCISFFSLGREFTSRSGEAPRREELAAICAQFGILGSEQLSMGAGEGEGDGADDRFLALVVKLTELTGRHVETARAFEMEALQHSIDCVHSPWMSLVEEVGLRFLTAGNSSECPCVLVLGKEAATKVESAVLGPDHHLTKELQGVYIRFRRDRVRFMHSCRADDRWKKKNPQYAHGGSIVLSCRARMCRGARVSARHSGK